MNKSKTASEMAISDMMAYMEDIMDEYTVSPHSVNSKLTRKLNRQLGLHRLNYFNNKNGSK